MKLSRIGLRRLIESVVNEQSNDVPEYSKRKIEQFDDLVKDYARQLQFAMHGMGHDRTTIGKINKTLTGLGTDEETIENVFQSIKDSSESELAHHYQAHGKPSSRLTYAVIGHQGKGILQLVGIEYEKAGQRLSAALKSELSPGEAEVLFAIIKNYNGVLLEASL